MNHRRPSRGNPLGEYAEALGTAVPRPFWLDTPAAPEPRTPLTDHVETDLLVIGSGLTGLWAALQACEERNDRSVMVLEGDRVASGASGRNGGFCSASLTHGVANGLARWPAEMEQLEEMGRENLAGIKKSPVISLSIQGEGIVAQTKSGTVYARRVLLATSAFRPLVRLLRRYIVPVYEYVLVTEPLDAERLRSLGWEGRQGMSDMANQFHYYRLTADNRILWGGYDAIYHYGNGMGGDREQRPETFERLVEHFFATFPQLRGLNFTHRWGGAIDTCSRFAAMFGTEMEGRLAYAMGFTGLGVGASRFGARVALDLVDGLDTQRTRLEMVRSKPIPFPPEPLRYAAIQLTRHELDRADRNRGNRSFWLRTLDRLGLGFDS